MTLIGFVYVGGAVGAAFPSIDSFLDIFVFGFVLLAVQQ